MDYKLANMNLILHFVLKIAYAYVTTELRLNNN